MYGRAMLLVLLLAGSLFPACSRFLDQSRKADIVVASDGSGDYKTIQDAIAAIPLTNRERIVVFIKKGTYREKIRVNASCLTLRGQSRKETRIQFSQLKNDFTAHPDEIGLAVINLNEANDFVLENLTVENTANSVLAHAFTISGSGDRTVIVDCDVLSQGGDTLALGGRERGYYYHARCNFSGSVDFVCPRGSCYITDSNFYAYTRNASVWHEGNDQTKFIMRNCRFDGVNGFILGRGFRNPRFYFLDCRFSRRMRDEPIRSMFHPLNSSPVPRRLQHSYFYNCHRSAGDFDWFTNNLSSAPGAPKPNEISAAWTFAGKWDPENRTGPTIQQTRVIKRRVAVTFSEPVTVKGKPRLKMCQGGVANYVSGSGDDTLCFERDSDREDELCGVDLNGGAIIASQASAMLRSTNLEVQHRPNSAGKR